MLETSYPQDTREELLEHARSWKKKQNGLMTNAALVCTVLGAASVIAGGVGAIARFVADPLVASLTGFTMIFASAGFLWWNRRSTNLLHILRGDLSNAEVTYDADLQIHRYTRTMNIREAMSITISDGALVESPFHPDTQLTLQSFDAEFDEPNGAVAQADVFVVRKKTPLGVVIEGTRRWFA